MSSDWVETTLGDICRIQGGSIQTGPFGSQLHTSDYTDTGIPVVMPTNIREGRISQEDIARIGTKDVERLSQHQLKIDDIVFSRRGDVTKNSLISKDEDGWLCGTGCLKVRLGQEQVANARFISYLLCSPESKDWLVRHAVGATMPNLNTGILAAIPVRLPPLTIQKGIAGTIGVLNDRITLLRETNKTLESIARAIFKSWFVDFDPVRAKMEGRQPEGMDEETAALFPDSFEESELGLVPRGWQIRKFLETVDVIGGGTPKTSNPDYWNGGIPWFSVVDAPELSDVWVVRTEKKISEKGLNESSTKLLPVGTTIISARGTVGKLALTGREMAMNQSCYGLRGKYDDVFFTYFSTKRLVDSLRQHSHGSVFDTITKDTLSRVKVVLPAIACLEKFEQAVDLVMKQMLAQSERGYCISQIRDTLLPRLISGQLRLPEAQEKIEAALL